MPVPVDLSKLSVKQFAEQFREEMIPLSNSISYFCASVPMSDEDLREYLEEPVAALPPSIAKALPKISILLVPYLQRPAKTSRTRKSNELVSTEPPPEDLTSATAQVTIGNETVLAFALKDREVAEHHYRFYHQLAQVLGDQWTKKAESQYGQMLREELSANVHGEVDETSWRLKQTLLRSKAVDTSKQFAKYARASFVDTLTLYLHGICCDIDVETGPRQLPSRYLRKRLLLLEELYPPPQGYAVFPEQT